MGDRLPPSRSPCRLARSAREVPRPAVAGHRGPCARWQRTRTVQVVSATFGGVVNRTAKQSVPWWPAPNLPDESSPNVVVVLLDDAGFAHFGCYGAPIETPTFDQLAANGLRFTNFTVAAVCSPTRASLLTGRNHHSVGMRFVANFDTGFPNMRGGLPKRAATMARVLRDVGYATFAVG